MNKRNINIEFIRIFAIVMTIAIHVSNLYINSFGKISDGYFFTSVIFNSMSRICVPLFFMISGAFAIGNEYTPKKYFNRIFKFVLILIIWSFIYYIQKNGFSFNNIGKVLINSIFNANMTSRHLWYMYAFIGIYIALPFIQNMCKNLNRQQENLFLILWLVLSGFSVILVPIARFVTNTDVDITYPLPIVNSAYYLGYFISGHIMYKRFYNYNFNKQKTAICILTYLTATAVTALITYYFSIKTNKLFDYMMWYKSVFTIIASFAIFTIFVANKNSFKSNIVFSLSKHSFGIYLIHIVFINIMKSFVDITAYNPILSIPFVTLLVYIISLISCIILSKIPYVNKTIF